jgi:hypothetical protein
LSSGLNEKQKKYSHSTFPSGDIFVMELKKGGTTMIRRLKTGEYRIYSKKINPKTGHRRNLGTFKTREEAQKHERDIQFFKRH